MAIVPIQLDLSNNTPLYRQIAHALKEQIKQGQLSPETKLPPIRELAEQLGVNNSTVAAAYKELVADGYAYSKVGSGTFVRAASQIPRTGIAVVRQISVPEQGINFASSTPTPDVFPVQDFKNLINRVLDRDGGLAFAYQESQGYYPLRQSLADYLHSLGISTSPENVHVISGAQQGIDLVAKALVTPEDTVVVESPTYQGAIASFSSRGARIISVPIEDGGPNLELLANLFSKYKPRLFYTMPYYQNPTGYSYSAATLSELLKLLREYDVIAVEDDYLSELSFTGRDNRPLKTLDKEERVIYIKSFSKILMPGLRMGLLVAPAQYTSALIAAKQHSDISTSGLLQRTFDLYLRDNIWQKSLQHMKKVYHARYDTLVAAIKQHFPSQITVQFPDGGLHLWVKLPARISSLHLYEHCRVRDVLITPGTYFAPDNHRQYFRLSFAAVHREQIERGITIVADVINRLLDTQRQELQPLL